MVSAELPYLAAEDLILISVGSDQAAGLPVGQVRHHLRKHFQKGGICLKRIVDQFVGALDNTSDQRVVLCDVADQQSLGDRGRVGELIEKTLAVMHDSQTTPSIDHDFNRFCLNNLCAA